MTKSKLPSSSGASTAPPPPPPPPPTTTTTTTQTTTTTGSTSTTTQTTAPSTATTTQSTPQSIPQNNSNNLINNQNNSAEHHKTNQNNNHSRLTRFLSKFTTSSIHSKRKSSLPNLNQPQPTTSTPTTTSTLPTSKRSLSHHLPIDLNSTLKPNSISLQPLLPLPTIADRRSTSSSHLIQNSSEDSAPTDLEDGADPNASIRPLTPSSKAASMISPNDARTARTDLSSIDPTDQDSPTDSRDSERRYGRRKRSSISSCSSEPDDCKSTFGNSSLASTKPTTVVSVENPPGNRIAQPHHSPIIHSAMAQPSINLRNRAILSHQRIQSGSPNMNAPPTATTPTLTLFSSPPISPQNQISIVNVPTHSLPHPSQNPHPAALADNASIITLASSGFSPSLHNNQNFQSDEDASVRALAPSRRESIESLSSRWSNMKSNRSTRTTGTGTNFFTGIPTVMSGEHPAAPTAGATTPTTESLTAPVKADDERPDLSHSRVQSVDLADRSDIVSLDVPPIGLVNG